MVFLRERVGCDHEIEGVELVGIFRLHAAGVVSRGMGRVKHDVRCEFPDLVRPVGEQGGRNHQQARTFLALCFQAVQQCKNLHGLAQSHVIGKAHAELQRVQEGEPGHAILLIGPQVCLEGRA